MIQRFSVVGALLLASTAWAVPLDSVVAVVNDGVITQSELDKQTKLLQEQLKAHNMKLPEAKALEKQVLQHLIDVDLQLQLAKKNNITIDDGELNDAISKIAQSNKLTLAELKQELAKQGLSWDAYRENIRKEFLLSRVQQKAVSNEVQVSPKQVERYLQTPEVQDKSNWTFHVQNIVIPLSEEPSPNEVLKAQSKATELLAKLKKGADFGQLAILESSGEFALEGGDLGERHLAELPDVFAKKVVTMQAGDVAGPIRAANGFQLIKVVAIHGDDSHHQVTKTHVRHILLKQDVGMNDNQGKMQAENIYRQLLDGKDFSQMAKHYSADAPSSVKGGDLGWVTPGELVPPFEEAMNKLPVGQTSKPVKSVFGWHIIQVLERKTVDDSESYKRQKVRMFLQQRKFSEAVQNWLQHLRSEAYIKVMRKDLA